MRINTVIRLIFWIVLFQSIGFLLGLLTQANLFPWYAHLNKSSLTPPGFLFSIIWSFLYTILAIIGWMLSNSNKKQPSKSIITLYTLQMLMNWAWTPLFFQLHWIAFSAIWLLVLTGLNVILIIKTSRTHKIIAYLLMPYVLWLMFASYLNGFIALMN